MAAVAIFAKGNNRTIANLIAMRKEAYRDKEPKIVLRVQAIILSIQKYSGIDISGLLKVHRSRVHAWITNWNEYGGAGLLEGYRSGRPSRLSKENKEQLYDLVESGPVAYGFDSGVWTSPMVSQIIEEEFDVCYHPGHVRKLLKEIGFSVQRPTTQLVQADPKKRNKWIRYRYPDLKKTRSRKTR